MTERKILEEDEYQAALSSVVENEFFPELKAIKAMTGGGEVASSPPKAQNISEFHANYQSEDDESFQKLIQEQNHQLRMRNHWAYADMNATDTNSTTIKRTGHLALTEGKKILAITDFGQEGREVIMNPDMQTQFGTIRRNDGMLNPIGFQISDPLTIPSTGVVPIMSASNTRLPQGYQDDIILMPPPQRKLRSETQDPFEPASTVPPQFGGTPNTMPFVHTPSIADIQPDTPFYTFGQILSTPIPITAPHYKPPAVRERDRAAHILGEKARKNMKSREKQRKEGALATQNALLGRTPSTPGIAGLSASAQQFTLSRTQFKSMTPFSTPRLREQNLLAEMKKKKEEDKKGGKRG
ncbi:hypothetical protein BLNAU_13204 [Blattamonas nauphoetae]|uniref:Uncharacterized protein n=1 Tax=Blattamonas nauphoetae TaxID=2049346 RepID=A0ABQ9XNX8_9EUKA|nr:hypothetical protein BLNAU_13204 [Blattamonas nauphoetae]